MHLDESGIGHLSINEVKWCTQKNAFTKLNKNWLWMQIIYSTAKAVYCSQVGLDSNGWYSRRKPTIKNSLNK